MVALTEVFVPVRPDMDRFEPEVRRKLSKIDARDSGRQVATRFGVGFNGAIGGIVSKSAGVFAAGFAAVKGVQVFGGFVKDAAESAKVSRITANAIRTTGGAAKISAAQVSALATAISNKTAIDDEQVQTAANMLLTFKNIRNETGKGNDVFNQATQAAADLSVQFGGIDAASKQLGKALNDPIKGTTALAKSGVTFTDQQKKQIKTLVESGKTLEAQKIILTEINSQVGGAAAAAADPMERLKVVAGNLGEEVGGFLLPHVERFSNFVSNKVIPGISGLANLLFRGDFTSQLREAFNVEEDSGFVRFLLGLRDTAIKVFTEVKGGITAFAAAWKFNDGEVTSSGFPGFMERLGFAARRTFEFFKAEVLPRLKEFATYIRDVVIPIVVRIAGDVLQKLRVVFNDVRAAIERNKPQLTQLVNGFISVAKVLIEKVIPFLYRVGSVTLPFLGKAIGYAVDAVGGIVKAFNAIKEPARAAIAYVVNKFLGFVENILTGASKAFGWVPELGPKLKGAAESFRRFKEGVNRQLDGISDEPVNIKVDLAYTKALGQNPALARTARKDGGMLPGYTPGRDVHRFFSATGGILDLSGGEPVLRPEAGAVLGRGWVDGVNGAARTGGKGGVRRFLGGFASGGLIPHALLPSGDRVAAVARAAQSAVSATGTRLAQAIAKQLVAGRVNPGLAGALAWARSQDDRLYQWGGMGNPGWDCSGFMSGITNIILGRSPGRRLFATGSFPTAMFARGLGAFSIGSRRGNPGHMAGTLNGVNVESRGGDGVVIGRGARGATDPLFGGNIWHLKGYKNGGILDRLGDAAFDLLNPRGKHFLGVDMAQALGRGILLRDSGGPVPRGTSIIQNNTSRPERILSSAEESRLKALQGLLTKNLELFTAAIGKNVEKINDLLGKYHEVAAATTSSFTGALFGSGTSVADLGLRLQARRNDATGFKKSLQTLKAKGLSRGLWEELARSSDYMGAAQLAQMSRSEIAALNRQYSAAGRAVTTLGNYAGNALYGNAIRNEQAVLRKRQEVRQDIVTALKQVRFRLDMGNGRTAYATLMSNS